MSTVAIASPVGDVYPSADPTAGILADGESSSTITVEVTGEDGPVDGLTGDNFSIDVPAYADYGDVSPVGPGEYGFEVTSTEPDDVPVSISVDGESGETPVISFVAGDSAVVDAVVTRDGAAADGSDPVEFTVTATDAHDNPVADEEITVERVSGVAVDGLDVADRSTTGDDGRTTFTATSAEPGEVTATFGDTMGNEDDATATFAPTYVEGSLAVELADDELPVGAETAVTVTAAYSDGTERDVTDRAALSTDDASIASVTDDGTVTAAGEGTVDVEAGFEGEAASDALAVTEAAYVDGSLSTALVDDALTAGEETDVTVTAAYTDGSVRDVTEAASLSSGDPTVATVTDDGTVRATGAGATDIVGAYHGDSDADGLTVDAAGDLASLEATVVTDGATADGDARVAIEVRATDDLGNEIDGVPVSVADEQFQGVDPDRFSWDAETVETDDGVATVSATSTDAGSVTASFASGEITSNEVTATFEPGEASARHSTVEAAADELIANGIDRTTVTVTVRDEHGNRLTDGGNDVAIDTTLGTLTDVVDGDDGTYAADLNSTGIGTAELTASVDDDPVDDADRVEFVPGTVDAARSTVTAHPNVGLAADGAAVSTVTIEPVDAHGHPVTGLADGDFTFLDLPAGATVDGFTAAGGGVYTYDLTSTAAGEVEVAVAAAGVPIEDTASVTFEAGAPSSGNSSVTADPTEGLVADGAAVSTVTIELEDASGNPVTGLADGTFAFRDLADGAHVGNFSAVGGGTYTYDLTSTAVGDVDVNVAADGVALADAERVTFGPGSVSPGNSSVTAEPRAGILADGADASRLTIELADARGHPLPGLDVGGKDGEIRIGLADPVAYSNVTDHGDGTYTADLTSTAPRTTTVTVTVETRDDEPVTLPDRPVVEFVPAPSSITDLRVRIDESTIDEGEETSLTVEANVTATGAHPTAAARSGSDGYVDVTDYASLDSDADSVATVDDAGVVTGRSPGVATLSGEYGGHRDAVDLRVREVDDGGPGDPPEDTPDPTPTPGETPTPPATPTPSVTPTPAEAGPSSTTQRVETPTPTSTPTPAPTPTPATTATPPDEEFERFGLGSVSWLLGLLVAALLFALLFAWRRHRDIDEE